MLEKSLGLMFFLKHPKNYEQGDKYIYLRITVDGVSKELSTKRVWDPARWHVKSGRAQGTKEDAKALNVMLDTITLKAQEARRQLIEENRDISSQAIKDFLTGIDNRKMILNVFADHNKQIEALIGKEYAWGTFDLFNRTYDHTKAFIKWKYGVEDLEIKKLDYEFISQYSFWLKTVRNCQHNTSVKYLTYFKKIVLLCVKHDWLQKDPFHAFKMTKKEVEKPFLTDQELEVISKKKFPSVRLSNVRDLFLFSCYTGLAYADLKKLRPDEIGVGVDGEMWIMTHRQKTDTASRIPLLEESVKILEKYQGHACSVVTGTVFPILTNQKMNAYLKEIADVCGIIKNLTFHTARHTFATTVTLSNGVPIETVAKMLGHKNLRQTQHYAKVLDMKVGNDMQLLREILRKRSKISEV
ncbi:site-specific integrase [Mucilaginibacter psychrotolerans]|uniref:Site-specific integrase n=1 Tax=Mucilaginibacter psychrotolerans TaxID=1524096 RepID=A0A4Y8S9Z0_9SPHI|nr:site-specific integrase [Mucilaginibacter psychrotolerans]TFF35501.1 site-specific integrase [Mucilaginibacter psychrotolerans]